MSSGNRVARVDRTSKCVAIYSLHDVLMSAVWIWAVGWRRAMSSLPTVSCAVKPWSREYQTVQCALTPLQVNVREQRNMLLITAVKLLCSARQVSDSKWITLAVFVMPLYQSLELIRTSRLSSLESISGVREGSVSAKSAVVWIGQAATKNHSS